MRDNKFPRFLHQSLEAGTVGQYVYLDIGGNEQLLGYNQARHLVNTIAKSLQELDNDPEYMLYYILSNESLKTREDILQSIERWAMKNGKDWYDFGRDSTPRGQTSGQE